jgi:hypothetical protein
MTRTPAVNAEPYKSLFLGLFLKQILHLHLDRLVKQFLYHTLKYVSILIYFRNLFEVQLTFYILVLYFTDEGSFDFPVGDGGHHPSTISASKAYLAELLPVISFRQ